MHLPATRRQADGQQSGQNEQKKKTLDKLFYVHHTMPRIGASPSGEDNVNTERAGANSSTQTSRRRKIIHTEMHVATWMKTPHED